jgi:CheY-like chemotaxis protein
MENTPMTRVLVVDDSAVDRRLIGALLERDTNWTIEYAEDGSRALSQIKEFVPDLVVTDLLMPEMDGLELVTAIRIFHPGVPVILITAHGSESLALEALERGAASYVPKSQFAETLVRTVEQVLALARADRSHKCLIECLAATEFTFSLDNDPALIDSLVDLIQGILVGMALLDSAGRLRVAMALEQALMNALYRGNLEIGFGQMQEPREKLLQGDVASLVEKRRSEPPYRDRRVFVQARITRGEARLVVRDEGPGFDVKSVPAPDDPKAMEQERGRGLVLMRSFMDEVTFNEAGNEVTMVKRRDRAENETPATA